MLEVVLISVSLSLSLLAVAGAYVSWHASRARQVRSYEERIGAFISSVSQKLGVYDSQMAEHKSAMSNMLDEMGGLLDRANKERRRIAAENQRAEARAFVGANEEPDIASLTRNQQLERVKALFQGR